MMPSSHSVLGATIECALREMEAAVIALEAGDQVAAAAAFADLSVHADTARRILNPRPYDDIGGEAGGVDAFKPFQNRFKIVEGANPSPTGAGKAAETPSQALTAPTKYRGGVIAYLPEPLLREAEARRGAAASHPAPQPSPETSPDLAAPDRLPQEPGAGAADQPATPQPGAASPEAH